MAKGSCLCGAVAFEIQPPYRFFQYCHCNRCRKRTGSIHAANIALPAAQFTWLAGEANVQTFRLATAPRWSAGFCTTCGSAMPFRTRDGTGYVVPSGALDDDPGEQPTRNVWTGSRAPWEVAATALPDVAEG